MSAKTTIGCFKSLIILECGICINRSYLLLNSGTKTICDFFYWIIYIFVTALPTYEIIVSYPEVNTPTLAYFILTAAELLALSIAAKHSRKKFIAVEKLDSKFGCDDDYTGTLKRKADFAAAAVFVSLIADVFAVIKLKIAPSLIMVSCLLSAALDAEMNFISLFVNIINIRLEKSIKAHPSFGCTVYRHIMIAIAYFNNGFQFSILLILLVTLINTITYGFSIVLFYSEMTVPVIGFLAWREIKLLYSLWVVCLASYRTEVICKELGFKLASKLALDTRISNDSSSKGYRTLYRWYTSVTTHKIVFKVGEDLPTGLYVPLTIMDVSVNYLLVLMQFYMAYK